MDCSICCFTYNKTSRKEIECLNCNNKTCSSCVKKYLLGTLEDPHCMHCKHRWDIFFVNKNLPRNFMTTEWKKSRSNLLFNREKSFFPQTMPLVALEIEKEKLHEEIREIEKKEAKLKMQKIEIYRRINTINGTNFETKFEKVDSKQQFSIRQCPLANCKGFLDVKSGLCVICNHYSCLKCNVVCTKEKESIEEENHECKQDDIETWSLIVKNSKPCPNCGTRIQRASGCSQMWCPGCHKAFNWNTGKIETGPIHNPHYYEWAQRIGVQPNTMNGPMDCNNQRRIWNIYNYGMTNATEGQRKTFRTIHRSLNHYVHFELPNLRNKLNLENTDLRIKFLRNTLVEENYKKTLMYRETAKQKATRIVGIYETMEMLSTQILQRYLGSVITIQEVIEQMKQLESFVNESIIEINQNFKSHIGKILIC